MGNALKRVDTTKNEVVAESYIVLFNKRDLEGLGSKRKNADGTVGEFFTKNTKFDSRYTALNLLPVDFEHGADVLSSDEVLGRVDWSTKRIDEKGVFVKRILDRRNRYVRWLEELLDQGLLATSSEAIAEEVKRSTSGMIQAWPLRRDSITATPMQFQMLDENALRAAKALQGRLHGAYGILQAHDKAVATKSLNPALWQYHANEQKRRKLEVELLELELLMLEA